MIPSNRFWSGRHAGVLLPLFAAPSSESWGSGEISDIPLVAAWLKDAGFDFLQVLPLNEMSADDHSPYAAVTAMAIDPIFISLRDVPDFETCGGEESLSTAMRDRIREVRVAGRVD